MTEIVKVQVPLHPKGAPAQIFPKGGDDDGWRAQTRRLEADTLRQLNGDAKGYFKASWVSGKWKLGRRVKDQGW